MPRCAPLPPAGASNRPTCSPASAEKTLPTSISAAWATPSSPAAGVPSASPGDLDLVAWDGPTLVVFEVKTRTASSREAAFAPAETSVDPHKQHVLRKMASAYLRQFPAPTRTSIAVRFDILSVYQLPTGIEFEQIRNAFPSRGARG